MPQQRNRDAEPLTHAAGEPVGCPVRSSSNANPLQQRISTSSLEASRRRAWNRITSRADMPSGKETRCGRYPSLDTSLRSGRDVATVHQHAPPGGTHQPDSRLEGGTLARSIGPDEGERLSRADLEVQMLYGRHAPIRNLVNLS